VVVEEGGRVVEVVVGGAVVEVVDVGRVGGGGVVEVGMVTWADAETDQPTRMAAAAGMAAAKRRLLGMDEFRILGTPRENLLGSVETGYGLRAGAD
jgi:hypothetical protein